MPTVKPPPCTNIKTGTSFFPFGTYRSRRWRYLSAPSPVKYVRFGCASNRAFAGAGCALIGAASDTSASAARIVFMALRLCVMADCLFCKIIERKIPASIVFEDQRVLAFSDINPQAPTHVLVIPKRHIESLNEIGTEDDQLIGEVVRRAAMIAKDKGLSAGGFRAVFNTNKDAGQTVFHVHLHLLGGRPMHWPPG